MLRPIIAQRWACVKAAFSTVVSHRRTAVIAALITL